MNILSIFDGMTTLQIIGNVVSFFGAIAMVLVGFIKKREHIIGAQCVQFGLMGAGNLFLGGISGVVSNVVSIVRNLIVYKTDSLNIKLKIIFIAIQAVLTAIFDLGNVYGLLPLAAGIIFTFFLDTKDARVLKVAIIAGEILWLFYDIHNRNYASLVMDVITLITNTIGIVMIQLSMNNGRLDKSK